MGYKRVFTKGYGVMGLSLRLRGSKADLVAVMKLKKEPGQSWQVVQIHLPP